MQQISLIQHNSNRLILFFAGWGMDHSPFRHIQSASMDVMICYDYTDLSWDSTLLHHYDEVHLVAWSMGVWVAEQLLHSYPLTTATAINGTPLPIDDQYGIPSTIFAGTLDQFSDKKRTRFNRRMCGSMAQHQLFEQTPVARSTESLAVELAAIEKMVSAPSIPTPKPFWTKAMISEQDLIFPTANLKNYWLTQRDTQVKLLTEASHYPFAQWNDWCEIIALSEQNKTSDFKKLITDRFTRAQNSYNQSAVAQQQIHKQLYRLLNKHPHRLDQILEIGCGTGGFTRLLQTDNKESAWILNDLCPLPDTLRVQMQDTNYTYLQGDAETLPFSGVYTLIASASTIQWFSDPAAFIQRMARLLSEDGIFVFNTFGKQNLHEVKALTQIGLTYPTLQEVEAWAANAFDIEVMEEEEITLWFDSPLDVLKHLKQTGVTATQQVGVWTAGRLKAFIEQYHLHYSTNGKVHLTYHPLYFVLRKRNH
jgi:malonyl-ACP O-methyltransferase BioC